MIWVFVVVVVFVLVGGLCGLCGVSGLWWLGTFLRDGCGTGLSPISLTTPILVYIISPVALTLSAHDNMEL